MIFDGKLMPAIMIGIAPPARMAPRPVVSLRPYQPGYGDNFQVPERTSTMAQKFIQSPSTRWIDNYPHRVCTDVLECRKLLIWARMMLLNLEDLEYFRKADIDGGIMASI
jgi:hypothetical protein